MGLREDVAETLGGREARVLISVAYQKIGPPAERRSMQRMKKEGHKGVRWLLAS